MKNIKRDAIKEDLLFSALPAVITLFVGLVVSMLYAADSIVIKILALVDQPRSIANFSLQNFTGLFLVISGFIILITAQTTLGKFYSSSVVIRNNHQLITHGIYRYTRNPIYLGVIFVFFGIPIFVSSLLGLLIMSALIPIFLYRIRLEERLLLGEFGDTYL
jgi:protein-S-isoprenylcysteine O-methyltransferase Ste14